jgi:hypothetical protein
MENKMDIPINETRQPPKTLADAESLLNDLKTMISTVMGYAALLQTKSDDQYVLQRLHLIEVVTECSAKTLDKLSVLVKQIRAEQQFADYHLFDGDQGLVVKKFK